MRRAQRLANRRDFAAVYRRGRPYRTGLLVLRALPTGRELSRFGFTVRKELGNAVVRNRLKRRLREAVRSLRVGSGWDLVINARRGAPNAEFQHLTAALRELMSRAGVLQDSEEAGAR
jgi:ribonuclease P protein component